MILVSTGFWIDQSPGAECVAGVSLVLTPGPAEWRVANLTPPAWLPPRYGIDLLAVFEHPVDTRPRAYERALMLAVTDLPEAGEVDRERPRFMPWDEREALLGGDWWKPEPVAFRPPFDIWSRVRHYRPGTAEGRDGRLVRVARPVKETMLVFREGRLEPETVQAGDDHDLAWGQAGALAERSLA